MHLQRYHGSLCEHPWGSVHTRSQEEKIPTKTVQNQSQKQIAIGRKSFFSWLFFVFSIEIMTKTLKQFPFSPTSHSPISSSPNQLLTNPKQYCSHRVLNPGLLAPQLTPFSTRPLVSCFTRTKKCIFNCFNFIFQGILGLNVIFDSQKVGKLSYLLW